MSDSIKLTSTQFHKKFPCCSIECIRFSSSPHSGEIIIYPHFRTPQLYTWCRSVACPLCLGSWYIRTSCLCQRTFTKEQLRAHHTYHHSSEQHPKRKASNEIILPTLPSSSSSSNDSSISYFD